MRAGPQDLVHDGRPRLGPGDGRDADRLRCRAEGTGRGPRHHRGRSGLRRRRLVQRSEIAQTDTGTVSGMVQTAIVWTSSDGKTWQRVPDDPVFADARLGQVIAWKGELLAYGCAGCGMESGPTTGWSSTDGLTWTRFTPTLPAGSEVVGIGESLGRCPVGDRRARPQSGDPNAPQQPPRLTSVDGRTWTVSPLPVLGFERLHPLPDGLYLTVMAPAADSVLPAWVSRTSALYRSTDQVSWVRLVADQPVGDEIIAVGDTLIMVGSSGDRCESLDGRCVAAAWRSTDGGSTWQSAPVTGAAPAGVTRSTMTAVAPLHGRDARGRRYGPLWTARRAGPSGSRPPSHPQCPLPSAPTGGVPDVLTVTCTRDRDRGRRRRVPPSSRTALHIHIRNTSGTERIFDIEGVGGDSAPVDGLQVWRLPTGIGAVLVRAGRVGPGRGRARRSRRLLRQRRDRHAPSATNANFDHKANAVGPKRGSARGRSSAGQGPPDRRPGASRPATSGARNRESASSTTATTVAVAGYLSDGAGGWLLTNTSICAGTGISWAP